MADNKKAVELNVGATTSGGDSLDALIKNLSDLAADGKALPDTFDEASSALEASLPRPLVVSSVW